MKTTKYSVNQRMRYCPKCKEYKTKKIIKNNNFKCPSCGYDFHKDAKPIPLK